MIAINKQVVKEYVDIILILDMSGSMDIIKYATIASVNNFIDEQKNVGDNALLTLTLFDTIQVNQYVRSLITNVLHIDDFYKPSGRTALYDAIFDTIKLVESKDIGNNKVIVVIVTDGENNASLRHTLQDVSSLVDEKRKQKWEFMFLGANIDAFVEGSSLGVNSNNISQFDHTNDGVRHAFTTTSQNVTGYRMTNSPKLIR
jgi:uncharacterized protein YegL